MARGRGGGGYNQGGGYQGGGGGGHRRHMHGPRCAAVHHVLPATCLAPICSVTPFTMRPCTVRPCAMHMPLQCTPPAWQRCAAPSARHMPSSHPCTLSSAGPNVLHAPVQVTMTAEAGDTTRAATTRAAAAVAVVAAAGISKVCSFLLLAGVMAGLGGQRVLP